MTKSIVLCADDYGQASSISAAIIELIQLERLTATSCLVNSTSWPEQAAWLAPFKDKVDIGLHLNLTEGKALSADFAKYYGPTLFPLPQLLLTSALRQLNKQAIKAELTAQLERFVQLMGFLPDFMDGHQHIHQFPLVRDVVIDIFKKNFLHKKYYLRRVQPHFKLVNVNHNIKSMLIYLSGAKGFAKLLKKNNIAHNSSFSGIYPFADKKSYRQWFQQFLIQVGHQGLIMCHPGYSSTETVDSIHKARQAEFDYLKSEQFVFDCQQNKVSLQRFTT